MKRRISVFPSVIVLCSLVNGHSVSGNDSAVLRQFGTSSSSELHLGRNIEEKQSAVRLLEEDEADANDDAVANEQDDDENTNIENTSSTINDIKSKVQSWEATAEESAWEFYQSPPSEWTEAQWDVFFGILVLSFLTCGCVVSACCAYCCLQDDDDGGKYLVSPLRNRNSRQYGSGIRRSGRSRGRDDEDYYNRYEDSGEYTPKGGCLV